MSDDPPGDRRGMMASMTTTTKKRGRPRKPATERRTELLSVSLTKDEMRVLHQLAKEDGCQNVRELVRKWIGSRMTGEVYG